MRDIERDRNKENEPARRSLEFNSPFTNRKPTDHHVGIGNRTPAAKEDLFPSLDSPLLGSGKRARSPEEEDFPSLMIDMPEERRGWGAGARGDATPTKKRQRTGTALAEISENMVINFDKPVI